MSQVLADGTVIPGFFDTTSMPTSPNENAMYGIFSDLGMRIGVVVAAYAPTDEKNTSKKVWQYDVLSSVSDGMELSIPQLYPRCVVASMFGGVADFFRWKPRIDTETADQDSQTQGKLSNNSYVLAACSNGDSRHGYIVGAIPHPNAEVDPAGEPLGDAYVLFKYNGVQISIENDGDLIIQQLGPTKVDGKPVKESNNGSRNRIRLNNENQQIIIAAGGSGSGAEIVLDSENNTINITSDDQLTIKAGSIETKTISQAQGGFIKLGGNEQLIKGNKYLAAEAEFLQGLTNFVSVLTTAMAAAASALSAPPTTAAGTALQAFAVAGPNLVGAIQTFSGQILNGQKIAPVLSQKNTTE